jgi:hypothetical protein
LFALLAYGKPRLLVKMISEISERSPWISMKKPL